MENQRTGISLRQRLFAGLALLGLFLIVASIAVALVSSTLQRPQSLVVTVFDVGQGDAILIRTPSGDTILVDGGPDRRILEKLGSALPFWDRTIDLVVLTHPHADHVTGLIDVLARYPVARILGTGVVHTTPEYLEFLQTIKDRGKILEEARRGDRFEFGDVAMEVLAPIESLAGKRVEELNNTSIVLRATYGETHFLLTGDAQGEVEEELLSSGSVSSADVLKVGHHGSKDASSERFLAAVHPTYAVISVGKDNSYGHPSPRTLARLERAGSWVLRTDEHGDIRFTSDGRTLHLQE